MLDQDRIYYPHPRLMSSSQTLDLRDCCLHGPEPRPVQADFHKQPLPTAPQHVPFPVAWHPRPY